MKNGPRRGLSCRKWPEDGSPICLVHGGAAPQNRKAARRHRDEARAEELLREVGGVVASPVLDPFVMLERLAGDVAALVDALRPHVASRDSLLASLLSDDLRPVFMAYERALDRSQRWLDAMGKLDIEERRLRLSEAQAALAVAWMLDALGRAGVPEEYVVRVRAELAKGPQS